MTAAKPKPPNAAPQLARTAPPNWAASKLDFTEGVVVTELLDTLPAELLELMASQSLPRTQA